jgi:hypothetical protein
MMVATMSMGLNTDGTGSESNQGWSSASRWALALAAAFVLYVLTMPLVLYFTAKPYPSDTIWLAWYLEPYCLVYDIPPVRHYHDWCRESLGTPYHFRSSLRD